MSKLSFRARQVDPTKPLPIYLNHDLPDFQDFAAINRSVPQMPTGMEKEEESEHHLQRALSALQAFGATSANEYAIPTPKVEIDNKMYERIYKVECPKYKQYIRIQPFSNDFDYPDYDVDYEDEEWLKDKRSTLPQDFSSDLTLYFECIMDRLEKATTHSMNLPSLEEAKMLLLNANNDLNDENDGSNPNVASYPKKAYKKERDEFILCIYEYWKAKRLKYKHPLTPIVLTDKSGVVTQPNNPFLVFRRRTEKMQTRKNRKNEEQSYEKMLILKRDLYRAQQILRLIKKRESIKKEFLKLTVETFDKRFKLNDYDGSLTDSITCSLRPAALNPLAPGTSGFSNLINLKPQTAAAAGGKDKTTIDSKIASLIHSNKLKQLDSPPSSFKRQEDVFNKSAALIDKQRNRPKKPSFTSPSKPTEPGESPPSKQKQTVNASRPANIKSLLDPAKAALLKPGANVSATALAAQQSNKNRNRRKDDDVKTNEFEGAAADEAGAVAAGEGASDELTAQAELENLETVLSETRNKLSTSSEKDGYWCFKRKEGCKYLLQNGSIFKNDVYEHDELFRPYEPDSERQAKRRLHPNVEKLHELQRHYYGYTVTKKHRHLGLVRRRMGRGGRVLLDRFSGGDALHLAKADRNNNSELAADPGQMFDFDFSAFRTYYPKDCFNLDEEAKEPAAVVPAEADAAQEPERKKLKFRSSFEDLVQDMNEYEDSDSEERNEPEDDYLERYFYNENEKAAERLFGEQEGGSLLQFLSETSSAEAVAVYGADMFAEQQMKALTSTKAPQVLVEHMDTAEAEQDEEQSLLNDTNFSYELESSDEEERDTRTLDDFFAPPVTDSGAERRLIRVKVPAELNQEYQELQGWNKDKELPPTVAKQAIRTLISLSMIKSQGIDASATESVRDSELDGPAPVKKKTTDADSLNDIFDSVINYGKDEEESSTAETPAPSSEPSKDAAAVSSVEEKKSPSPPVAEAPKPSEAPPKLTESVKAEPVVAKPSSAFKAASKPQPSINTLLSQSAAAAAAKLVPAASVSLTSNTIDSLVQSKPAPKALITAETPENSSGETRSNGVVVSVAATSTSLSSSTSFLVKTPQQITASPATSTSSPATGPSIPSHMFYSSPHQVISTTTVNTCKINGPSSLPSATVSSSVLLANNSTNIIVNGLVSKKKDETTGSYHHGCNNNTNNHGAPTQQELPSSTTPPPSLKPAQLTMPATSLNSSLVGALKSNPSDPVSTSSTASTKINTNLSSHLQMNDNKNYHNLNVNTFSMQHKKNVEAVISLNSTNVVSSTTTNENLPILEAAPTGATSDSNKSNVKPMEVT